MVLNLSTRPGDLVVQFSSSMEYSTKSAKIRNPGGAAINLTDVVGRPVVAGTNGADFNLAASTGEGNVVGLIMKGPPLALAATTNSTALYQVVHRGPVIVNQDKIVATDYAGVAWDTFAEVLAALVARGFEFRSEPTKQTQF